MKSNSILETERLTLSPCTPGDFAVFAELLGDAETMQYFGQCRPLSSAEASAWLESCVQHCDRHGWGPGVLRLRANGEVVGLGIQTFMLHDLESEEGDLIFIIRKAMWGQGFATEFARAAIKFMLRQTTITRIVATAMPENRPSNRVLEKAGMQFSAYDRTSNRNRYIAEVRDLD